MASDPLDQLQSMFPSIEGDVIAIVFSESDKDVSVTVEKLLQLVPDSSSEFPSLPSRYPPQHPPYLLPSPAPQRSSSGPPNIPAQQGGDQTNAYQQRNRRLQGPAHIPPNVKQQQQKSVGGSGNQRNQPRMHSQQNQRLNNPQLNYRGQALNFLGKRVHPGNQKSSGGVPLVGPSGQVGSSESGSGEMFYQMGGSGVNSSMPASLASMDPAAAPLFYHNSAQALQRHPQTQQANFSRTSYPHPTAVPQHRAQAPPPQHRGHQPGNKHWPPPVISGGSGSYGSNGGGGGVGGLYGYANFGQDGQYLASWMNRAPRSSDYAEQFYRQGQQTWPNVSESGLQYSERGATERAAGSYGGNYYTHGMNFPTGGDSNDQANKSDWPIYMSESSSIREHKANLDAIAALLHPETSPLSDGSFGRRGYVQSEPSSLSGYAQRPLYEGGGGGSDHVAGERGEHHGKQRNVAVVGEEEVVEVENGDKGTSAASSEEKGADERAKSEGKGNRDEGGGKAASRPRKLIILRGLPGSGKTTLAKSLVGAKGVICCTDDFFVKNREYVFDPSLLEENHDKNRKKARDAMVAGNSPVIIDNTNTNAWEMKPYVLLAMEHGYAVEILEPDTPWRFKTAELARRNSHCVPKQKIERMLERYDHRVTLETIVTSQQPERKPSTETGKNGGGGVSGGQKAGGRSKVSPPTPRQQQEGSAGNTADHAHHKQHTIAVSGSTAVQTRSGRAASPRFEGKKGQRSNDGRVSPRPPNQKSQKSKDGTATRNGVERKSGMDVVVSTTGDGKAGDSKKKNIPHSHQASPQTSQASQTSANSAKHQKGKKSAQQTSNKTTLPASTGAGYGGKKRALSPARKNQGSKPPSSSGGSLGSGKVNQRDRRDGGEDNVASKSQKLSNGEVDASKVVGKDANEEGEGGGGEDEEEDEFLWDSSEEAELLDGEVGNGPIGMTDTPPVGMSFRPVPQLGKSRLVNGESDGANCLSHKDTSEKQLPGQREVPIFEVWKDSDDEDIINEEDDQGQEDETPLPVAWLETGQKGRREGQALLRTPELPNIHRPIDEKIYTSSTASSVLAPPPSHPWERTQSAANFNDVNEHFVSLIRRVQSANPAQPLSSLSEGSSNHSEQDAIEDSFDVFSMSSVWGSGSGLLSSKTKLFDDNSNVCNERIDSSCKSTPSLKSADSADGQSERQQKRVQSSYFSMLDALVEEANVDSVAEERREVDTPIVDTATEPEKRSEVEVATKRRLFDEAILMTQDSVTVQEAIEDEIRCPLRNELISELVEEGRSLPGRLEKGSSTVTAEVANLELDTMVDVEHLLPTSSSSGEQGSKMAPPPFNDNSAALLEGGKPFSENFFVIGSLDGGANLEVLTEKIFEEEPLSPKQSFSTLQASLQTIIGAVSESPSTTALSSFAVVVDVRLERENESDVNQISDPAMFEDPAIVSKVCFESREGAERPSLIQSLMSMPEYSREVGPSSSGNALASPDCVEPISVFPSAYDDGIDVNFELSEMTPQVEPLVEAKREEAEEGEESRVLTNDHQSSPQQSQTPVNEQVEIRDDIGSQSSNGHGLESADTPLPDECGIESADTPLPTEAKEELVDDIITAPESTLTPSDFEQYLHEEANPPAANVEGVNTSPRSTFNGDLRFLTECFPGLNENYVGAILRMCNGNVEEALSVLLVSHSNQPDVSFDQTRLGSQFSADTTDDGTSSISSASYSEQQQIASSSDGPHPPDSSPEQQRKMSSTVECTKPVFSIGGGCEGEGEVIDDFLTEKQLVPYFQDSECENDEEIARALQEQLNLELPPDGQQIEEMTSIENNAIPDRQRKGRSSSHGKVKGPATLSGDENLELKLSASLARQLQDMFGPVTDSLPFEGDMREEDMVVLLSERAAREIYKKWVDTLNAKKIGYQIQYRALSESSAISDEVLARLLQEEEDKRAREKQTEKKKYHKLRHSTEPCSLAALATENYRAHHNSSPPQLGHRGQPGFVSDSPRSGENLVEIMNEQMAQQVHQDELAKVVEAKTGPNLSLKLQLRDLHSKFPDLEQSMVNETLVRNKFDIDATITELKGVVGQPAPPHPMAKDSVDGNVFGKGVLTFSSDKKKKDKSFVEGGLDGRSLAKRKIFNDGENESKGGDEGAMGCQAVVSTNKESQHQQAYIELRAEAALHAKLRAENFMKAAHARGQKQWEVAQYYAHQGHLHTEKMNEANRRAAKAILEHNTTSSDELDLHGLHVDEAIAALQEKIDSCKGSKLRVVTGQGIHSKGGGAKIRPAVIDYLKNRQYKILYEKNAGALTVKIR